MADEKYMQVLIVDDDPMNRNLVAIFVARAGHTVAAEADDGAVALQLLSRFSPDVIITDCQMPNLDGIGMVRQLRSAGNDTRVIMLSGQCDRAVIDAAIRAGVDAYLTKPMDPARLIAVLSNPSTRVMPAARRARPRNA